MRNKILFSIAFSLILFTLACTDDSLGGGSSIDPNAAPAVAKIDSISFAASEGSCNEDGVLKKVFVHDDSIHLYMNKDGSGSDRTNLSKTPPCSCHRSRSISSSHHNFPHCM
jgi:hypothetical protein